MTQKIEEKTLNDLFGLIYMVINSNKDIYGKSLSENTQFKTDLGFDSLMSLDLAGRIEQTYKISLTEESLENIKTIKDLHRFILKNKR